MEPSRTEPGGALRSLIEATLASTDAATLFRLLAIDPQLLVAAHANRAVLAQALNMLLFDRLLREVPDARGYAEDCLRDGIMITHDHGAVRTVVLDGMGALPSGEEAIVRILRPLGYRLAGTYPLDRLRMTGRSYLQADYPETVAQFFVSELHIDRFSDDFARAARSVLATSHDPLSADAKARLATLERDGTLQLDDAIALLPELVGVFARQHATPRLSDYRTLLAESAEMAWIATEGNVFNHATDRVDDVEAVAAAQNALGRAMKDAVEVAREGRVRQTAFRAAKVRRAFVADDGVVIEQTAPGSFYEFITRLPFVDPATGEPALDLAFDSGNAQGIFKMTERPVA